MPATYGTCRACGERLLRADHVRFGKVVTEADEKASGLSSRNQGDVYSWMHTPCPKCSEPRPLLRKRNGLLIVAAFAFVFGLGIWMAFG